MKSYQLALLGISLMMSMTVHAYDGDYYYNTQPRYYQQPSGSITIPLGNTYNSPSITFSVPTYIQQPPVVYQPYYAPPVVYHRPYYKGYTSYRGGEHRHHHGHYNRHHHDD